MVKINSLGSEQERGSEKLIRQLEKQYGSAEMLLRTEPNDIEKHGVDSPKNGGVHSPLLTQHALKGAAAPDLA
jgi:hypothetical protein